MNNCHHHLQTADMPEPQKGRKRCPPTRRSSSSPDDTKAGTVVSSSTPERRTLSSKQVSKPVHEEDHDIKYIWQRRQSLRKERPSKNQSSESSSDRPPTRRAKPGGGKPVTSSSSVTPPTRAKPGGGKHKSHSRSVTPPTKTKPGGGNSRSVTPTKLKGGGVKRVSRSRSVTPPTMAKPGGGKSRSRSFRSKPQAFKRYRSSGHQSLPARHARRAHSDDSSEHEGLRSKTARTPRFILKSRSRSKHRNAASAATAASSSHADYPFNSNMDVRLQAASVDIAAAASSDYPSSVDVRTDDVELPALPQMAFQCRCGKVIAGGSKSFRQHLHQSSKCRGARQPCAYCGKSVAVQAGSLAQHLAFCKGARK